MSSRVTATKGQTPADHPRRKIKADHPIFTQREKGLNYVSVLDSVYIMHYCTCIMKNQEKMTLAQLAEKSGVSARTIRFYIAKRLMEGPLRVGRGATYSQTHLDRLDRIQELKSEGYSLSEIRHRDTSYHRETPAPSPTRWSSYRIADDLTVNVRDDADPWRIRKIQSFLREMTQSLGEKPDAGENHDRQDND